MLDEVLRAAQERRSDAERDLFDYLSIPSISALPERREDCRRAANWLLERLRAMGLDTRLEEVREGGHPVLVAQWMKRPGAPTLTVYGHYDVQPPDPLEEWETPPFEPAVREGYVYARGANDNKGQHLAAVKALEYWLATGGPPVNVRVLVEGEEEISGKSLPQLLRERSSELASDYVLIADGSFPADGRPYLTTGLRGILYTEIEVTGAAVDLHSGVFGGVAPNPFNSLAHIIAGLKDRDGRIHIPGLMRGVPSPSEEEIRGWQRLGLDEEAQLRAVGLARAVGEPGYTDLERTWTRPTLDVHGVMGGFVGVGEKTVIPARARAKVSMRLVPGQTPAGVLHLLRSRVAELATPGTRAQVIELSSAPPVLIDTRHLGIEAASRAFEAAFGAPPVLTREGASIPVTIDFAEASKTGLIVTGFGLPGDRLHSPNERMNLEQFHRSTAMVVRLLEELAHA